MDKIINAAENYATRARYLDTLRSFDFNVQHSDVRVTWTNGSSCNGYKELSEAISVVVSEGWNALKAEAVRRAEANLAEALEQLQSAVGKSGDDRG